MKIYVWENVLHDYTAGMIVALAPNLDAALDMARSDGNLPYGTPQEMGANEPQIVDLDDPEFECRVWAVHGGG